MIRQINPFTSRRIQNIDWTNIAVIQGTFCYSVILQFDSSAARGVQKPVWTVLDTSGSRNIIFRLWYGLKPGYENSLKPGFAPNRFFLKKIYYKLFKKLIFSFVMLKILLYCEIFYCIFQKKKKLNNYNVVFYKKK